MYHRIDPIKRPDRYRHGKHATARCGKRRIAVHWNFMTLELSLYGLSSLALGFIGLFAAFVLALHDGERSSRPLWLSVFLVGLSLPMLMGFFEEAGWMDHPLAFYPPVVAAFTAGPALFLYARLPWRRSLDSRDWMHGVPLIVGILTAINWDRASTGDPANAFMLWASLMYLTSSLYAALTLRMLKRYRRALDDHFSDAYRHRLNWLRFASWSLLALIFIDVLFGVLLSSQAASTETARLTLSLLLSLTIFLLSLSALRNPARYLVEIAGPEKPRYASSRASPETFARWRERLQQVMRDEQPYLINDLSLTDLAGKLGISPHNLSQLLNKELGLTFYDFINRARIRRACELLSDTDSTVLEVAFDSGFNNKASFYTAFRQQMDATPSAYRLAAKNKLQSSSAA